ncbi:MAG: class II glutamine amidotransferase, partial [Bacteroidales bacterium]
IKKAGLQHPEILQDSKWLKEHLDFTGELFMGHLRYGTFGRNQMENIHPFVRENNWKSRNLVLAGNFNLTNIDELFETLLTSGQHPMKTGDTVTILEKIGKALDDENQKLYNKYKALGHTNREIAQIISQELDLLSVLKIASKGWDGGYVFEGIIGHGDAFVMRDPAGIRPAFYYVDDEVVVVASERPVIQTAFNVPLATIKALPPAHVLIVKRSGEVSVEAFTEPAKETCACSFERIYFSRGTDADIYKERKELGRLLTPAILETIGYDMENTVFSSIPNTASVAFHGLTEGLEEYCKQIQAKKILALGNQLTPEKLTEILHVRPRADQIAVKDAKMRTFIAQDDKRNDLVSHVYDVTYGLVHEYLDNLVVVDDSIVRGTTLKQSILRILDRLGPKHVVVASSAPQIRYPDCYGIDMAKLGDFCAFEAAIALLKDTHQEHIIQEVYEKSKAQIHLPKEEMKNYVREIYKPFTSEQISTKIAELLKPETMHAKVTIVYQTIENLHKACPEHKGDWYFTGKYPTPGGNAVVSRAFINYIENNNKRAY